jgi:hypothetical protein
VAHNSEVILRRRCRLLLAAAAVVVLLCTGCSAPSSYRFDPRDPDEPAYPRATLIRETESGGSCCFYPSDGEAKCPVWLTGYGTEDVIENVVAFYESLGFVGKRAPGGKQGILRWIGVLDGTSLSWRKVDVATGDIAGRSEWRTAFEVMAPDCERRGLTEG